ncbi:uncharacterized protein B0H64DRAFT_191430 [Chaetomium fimeti]|uniref:Secreted protein n=1 Tax=Chaetomium fimeti TaxID=1854472 RepID=A0AAE0HDY0_9PEZI|nr:hypothetical protein B0H64DRAFT_191430 [Chaetomium fimeti]
MATWRLPVSATRLMAARMVFVYFSVLYTQICGPEAPAALASETFQPGYMGRKQLVFSEESREGTTNYPEPINTRPNTKQVRDISR